MKNEADGFVFEAFPALIVAQTRQTLLASPTKDQFSKVSIKNCTIKIGTTVPGQMAEDIKLTELSQVTQL